MPSVPHPDANTYVAYLRDSGGETQELSIPQQRTAIEAWAAANAAQITRWYIDEARPASTTAGRDAFLAMIDHLRHDAPETGLVTWRMSRLTRNINDAQYYRADLRRRGYKIISLDDHIPEGPEAIFFEAALDWHNHRFLDDMSRDVKRGLNNLVTQYGCIPGTPPKGFKRQPVQIGHHRDGAPHIAHRWVIDDELAPAVRQAFQMRAAGHTLAQINQATHLYTSLNSYKTFYTNRLYIGELHYGDQVIQHYCEPLIDEKTWTAVQATIQQYAQRLHLPADNPRHPRRQNSPYLLTGLLHCAECGSPHFGNTDRSRPHRKPYSRYICTRAARRRDCPAKHLPCQVLDQAVLTALRQHLAQPDRLLAIQTRLNLESADRLGQLRQDRSDLAARLANTRRAIARLAAHLETAEDLQPRSILQRLVDLETQETGYQTQLNDLDARLSAPLPDLNPHQLTQLAHDLEHFLSPNTDLKSLQTFLRAIVQQITVTRTGHQIHGQITIYFPPHPPGPDPPTIDNNVPISHSPLGVPPHTYTFPLTSSLRPYTRK